MKFALTIVAIAVWLLCLAAGEVAQSDLANLSLPHDSSLKVSGDSHAKSNDSTVDVAFDDPDDSEEEEYRDVEAEVWHHAVCKGIKLLFGSTLNPELAIIHCRPLTTPWQGPLYNELATWGYREDNAFNDRPGMCEFADKYRLKTAFDALGIDTRDIHGGGPNRCFAVLHSGGPAVVRNPNGSLPPEGRQIYYVNGKRYRITGGHFYIGANSRDGYIYFLDRGSPATEARQLWDVDDVPADALPALRSSSDIAWGFWNRVSAHNLGNINGFFSVMVINDDTAIILREALRRRGIVDRVPSWPGVRFNSGAEEYNALLGSPNGLAAGYFLVQHKREMGGNKYVSYIVVFNDDREEGYPNLYLKVDWAPNPANPPPTPPPVRDSLQATNAAEHAKEQQERYPSKMESGRVLGRSPDGRQLSREHVIWAN